MKSRLAIAAALPALASAEMALTLFSDSEVREYGARCLDGSPSGYYFEAGAQTDKWVIYLQGGGACATESDCVARAATDLGSSTGWADTWTDSTNLLSTDADLNVDFFDWNHVFVPYGSGDCHTGTQTAANAWGLYFSGHNSVAGVLDKLAREQGLADASEIVLTGSSAGGIGTWNNVDFVADAFPRAAVLGVPQGGWFFPNVTTYAYWEAGEFDQADSTNATVELWNSFVDQSCLAANPTAAGCATMHSAYAYLSTPLFVVENYFDTNQIYSQLGCPNDGSDGEVGFIEAFGDGMVQSLSQVGGDNGFFLASCLDHTANIQLDSDTRVGDDSFATTLHNWYAATGGATQVADAHEDGGLPDNPTCTDWGSSRARVVGESSGRVFIP